MQSRLDKMFFSQTSLAIFDQCSMKFKKRYIDGLLWKNSEPNSQSVMITQKGRLFHLLAYRYFLGMDSSAGEVEAEYIELDTWVERLKRFIQIDKENQYFPEFELKISIDKLRLQAKYDLIVLKNDGEAVIYDWKVQEKKLNQKHLKSSWQTIVYRYLLAKAGRALSGKEISPEKIKMIYWQPTLQVEEEFAYSQKLFEQDEKLIQSQIETILNCHQPAKVLDPKICTNCEFCAICSDFRPKSDEDNFELEGLDWDEIEEIEF
jgi:CRISPR/Cas system-associated exonuclease Cas4 (RecB family)